MMKSPELEIGNILEDMGLNHCIQAFNEQQVTLEMVPEMTDESLNTLGVNLIGQRFELKARCRKAKASGNAGTLPKGVLALMKSMQSTSRGHSSSSSSKASSKASQEIGKFSISVGWKHYDSVKHVYKQVYLMKGGGTHSLQLERDLNYAEVLKKVESTFFPGGKNGRMRLGNLLRKLGNSVGDPLTETLVMEDGKVCAFTAAAYYDYCTTQRKRLYLLTKDVMSDSESDSESLPDPEMLSDDSRVVSLRQPHSAGPSMEIELNNTVPLPQASSTPVPNVKDPRDLFSQLIHIEDDSEDEFQCPQERSHGQVRVASTTSSSETKKVLEECQNKLLALRAQHVQALEDDYEDFQHIRVRRHALWCDTKKTLQRVNFDASKKIKVTFVGEAGVDDGGPMREFFSETQDDIFNNGSLFQGDSDKTIVHNVNALCSGEFKIAGQLIALSMVQGGRSPSCLSPILYSYIVGGISAVNPSCQDIRNSDIKEKTEMMVRAVDDSTLDSILKTDSMFDLLNICGIHPKAHYTLNDRDGIISRIALHDLILHANAEIHQFMDGLKMYDILQMLRDNPEGGRLLMCPSKVWNTTPEEFIDQLQEPFYSPQGSNQKMLEVDVYAYLIQFLEELSNEDYIIYDDYTVTMKDFLFFLTGSPCRPATGWPSRPRVEFVLHCYVKTIPLQDQPCKCFPTASTCTDTLRLPLHFSNYQVFERCMCQAVLCSKGFGLV